MKAKILAIDPGETKSGYIYLNRQTSNPEEHGIIPNKQLLDKIYMLSISKDCSVACEMIASYGMPVGKTTFNTVLAIGRFQEAALHYGTIFDLVYRKDVKTHICGSMKAKDSNIRQALIDRYGGEKAIGGKKCQKCKGKTWVGRGRIECPECNGNGFYIPPGPLYGITSHVWSALAIGVYWVDMNTYQNQQEPLKTRRDGKKLFNPVL